MKIVLQVFFCIVWSSVCYSQQGKLKSLIYDFDGQTIGSTNLPDGDYKNFDLTYEIGANPIGASAVLGDRVLKVNLNWAGGRGEFGKGITKHIQLDVSSDYLNFYCYNPLTNQDSVIVEAAITEDDNANGSYESAFDDKWIKTTTIPRFSGWQLISLPLGVFTDATSGGSGVFDASYTAAGGKVLTVSLTFKKKNLPYAGTETYFIDMISFSDGILPTGNVVTDLPYADGADHCLLGSLAYKSPADSVPPDFESLFPAVNKLHYVNVFMPYATSGSTPNNIPGNALQRLLNNGYTPIITWEMLYTSYSSMDTMQPRLIDIINGEFDTYYDAFADKVKLYTDTLYIRLFHEFDGDWYPWCISLNEQDPNRFIGAYRYIVDRFRMRGATNVKWIWSPNSSPKPNTSYNWIVDAYPGDDYVDIVATSIYNHPSAGTPPWRSFRSLLTDCYYYLTTYFPQKPFFICEMACRERFNTEAIGSQTKAEWLCQMDKDLKSYFSKTRALVFFNKNKEHDWRVNSSAASLHAVTNCLWEDGYYTEQPLLVTELGGLRTFTVFPNPFNHELIIESSIGVDDYTVLLYDVIGRPYYCNRSGRGIFVDAGLPAGIYFMELKTKQGVERFKLLKQ